jgi:PAS domain S-box-containing protein
VRQDQFVREMGAIRTRIGAFRKRAAAQPPGIELLPEALEELSGALEELRVSEEQMRVQADELASERVRLDEERRRFQELFELAPASYLVTDRAGMVREANRHACRALRTEWRFLDGRPLSAFVPLDDRFAFRGLLRQLDDGEPHGDVRLRLQPHGGAPLLATLAVSTVRDAGGRITRICWLARELAPAGQPAAAAAEASEPLRWLAVRAAGDEPPRAGAATTEEILRATLDELGEAAASVFHASSAGTMLLDETGDLRWLQTSDRLTRAFEQAQVQFHEGPCIDAFEEDAVVWTEDLRHDHRWPRMRAVSQGNVRAMLCAPIAAADGPIGTCNIISSEPRTWSRADIGTVRAYARAFGTLLRTAAEAYASSVLASQLQHALDQRVVIEQAKGILMERSGLSSQAAFERLRSTARSRHRKLADVAAEVVSGRR